MESFFANLVTGFSIAATPMNLLYAFVGCLVGTLIGVLPGLGSVPTVALLVPLPFGVGPTAGLILMAGVYYGAMYGGSTTSILAGDVGESSAVVTTLDGHPMAKQGRAGAGPATAAIGSFVAGTLSTVGLMLLAPPLAWVAISFGPAEYFSLMLLGLTAVSALGGRSLVKALVSMCLGLLLGTVGLDMGGFPRFNFGLVELYEGVDFIIPAIGLFALGEALAQAAVNRRSQLTHFDFRGRAWLTREEFRRSTAPWLRGSVLGFLVGVLPGAGAPTPPLFSLCLARGPPRPPHP